MKKFYSPATYDITYFKIECGIVTLSSDRENSYVGSDTIWEDFEFDDDD